MTPEQQLMYLEPSSASGRATGRIARCATLQEAHALMEQIKKERG